jgi:hypothetical protein
MVSALQSPPPSGAAAGQVSAFGAGALAEPAGLGAVGRVLGAPVGKVGVAPVVLGRALGVVVLPPDGFAEALEFGVAVPTADELPLGSVPGVVVSGVSLPELPQAIRVVQMRA